MHYVRLLRPPKLQRNRNRLQVELVFTITTDLGDSFLDLSNAIALKVEAHAHAAAGQTLWPLSRPGEVPWTVGSRVVKRTFEIPENVQRLMQLGVQVDITIRASDKEQSADGVLGILKLSSEDVQPESERGQIMPVWVTLNTTTDVDVSTRKLSLARNTPPFIEMEEEIGESIARHIWDGGVVALCAITAAVTGSTLKLSRHTCMTAVKKILASDQPVNVLEVGCGVGILGAGIGAALNVQQSPRQCTILMTDLEEAESRARSNITRLGNIGNAQLLYENLDWEDGRQGRFGPQAQSRRWDLVILSDCTYNVDMLPALVETLSAVHAANVTHAVGAVTKVFLATKPRHESEDALFDLLVEHGWATLEKQIVPLPHLSYPSRHTSVEMYLFEKR